MALAVATPAARYRVIGDDWLFRLQLTQADGSALDLTGATVQVDVYRAAAAAPVATLALGAGLTLTTTALAGTVDLLVPGGAGGVTSSFVGQDIDATATNYPNRLVPRVVDALGRRRSVQIVPIVPVDPRLARVIPPADTDPVTLTVGEQGPSGPPGSGGSGQAITVVCAEAIGPGRPVYVDRVTGQLRAARADTYLACFVAGITLAAGAAGFTAAVYDGAVALADWTAATGSADLVPGLIYFVDLAGGLTTTPPISTPGATVAAVGRATDARTLFVAPSNPIKL